MTKGGALVVVNADDVGGGDAIDEQTFLRADVGTVTSGSLLATGPTFTSAARAARARRRVSWGVHLDATGFPPLTAALTPWLDGDGRVSLTFRPGMGVEPAFATALADEWVAQVRRVREAGVAVDHLDTHENLHWLAPIRPIFLAVCRRVGVARARGMGAPAGAWRLRARARRLWNNLHLPRTTATTWTVRAFVDAGSPPARSVELVVHPGNTSNVAFARELRWLDQDGLRGWRTGSWRDIR